MIKDYILSPADDLTIVPSPALNRMTIEKMENAASPSCTFSQTACVHRHVPRVKRSLACAVFVCAALALMSAGAQVFSYLAFVPGLGILTQSIEDVYTLAEVVEVGDYHIEALSFVPVTEGEHQGEWQVTVLTDHPVTASRAEIAGSAMSLRMGGTDTVLALHGGTTNQSRYVGYIASLDGIRDCSLLWLEEEVSVSAMPLANSAYARYAYPASDGITLICFPMSEGSDRMVFDFILEPESENLVFWANAATSIMAHPQDIRITDVNGNIYHVKGHHSRSISLNAETEPGIVALMDYKYENTLFLDRRLEAPVASVSIDRIKLSFMDVYEAAEYTLIIPGFEETVAPEDGVYLDTHGIRAEYTEFSAGYDENGDAVVFLRGYRPTVDFQENVTDVFLWMWYGPEGTMDLDTYQGGFGYGDVDGTGLVTSTTAIENGNLHCGDAMTVRPIQVDLTFEGEWVIDFTSPPAK